MKKKVIIIGVGAQGSTIADRLNKLPEVVEIVCADYDAKEIQRLERKLEKASGMKLDANSIDDVIAATEGMDLLINGLPPDFNMNLMEAALHNEVNYQDMASGPVTDVSLVDAVKRQLSLSEEFQAKGIFALINTGSAPGLVNVVARHSADKMDVCERIDVLCYSGTVTKKFIPFWWSPETALGDMASSAIIFENGAYRKVPPFNDPQMIDLRGLGPRKMYDHEHEEPVTFGIFFKNLKYSSMKYGGPSTELSKSLYEMGLLSEDPVDVKGVSVSPRDLVCSVLPPAPSDPDSIRDAISEGVISEEGALVVHLEGFINRKPIKIDNYIKGLGLTEAFKKFGITQQAFITAQSAFLFSKLIVENKINLKGVFSPEVLEKETREYYLREAADLGIYVDEIIERRLF
jgi:saccharopine dehydrogenase-like NADP-dependent oxidoreductase